MKKLLEIEFAKLATIGEKLRDMYNHNLEAMIKLNQTIWCINNGIYIGDTVSVTVPEENGEPERTEVGILEGIGLDDNNESTVCFRVWGLNKDDERESNANVLMIANKSDECKIVKL